MLPIRNRAKHLLQGEDAEQACCHYLRQQGLKLLQKNFRCRFGEIDLIMQHGEMLVFVEVRFRKDQRFGGGLASITPAKQQKLRRSAEYYLQQHGHNKNARFDVVSMCQKPQTKGSYDFTWIENAF